MFLNLNNLFMWLKINIATVMILEFEYGLNYSNWA